MAKNIALPDDVYEDLNDIVKELSTWTKKPISMSMAIYLITAVYHAHLSEPCARDAFRQKLASLDIVSPEEFDSSERKDLPKTNKSK
jgi:hypothetical protein